MGTPNSLCNFLASSIHFKIKSCRHEFAQAPGNGDGQGSLACCSPGGGKELDMTERLNGLTEKSRTAHSKRASSRQVRSGCRGSKCAPGTSERASCPVLCSHRESKQKALLYLRKSSRSGSCQGQGLWSPRGVEFFNRKGWKGVFLELP